MKEVDIQLHSSGAWRSWREWSGKMKRIGSIMTTGTIGKRERKHRTLRENFCLFGGWAMRKRKNTLLQSPGIPNTKICLLFLLEVMISQSKKLARSWFGLSKTSLSLSTSTRACRLESCVLIGILLLLLCWQLVCTMVPCLFMMLETSITSLSTSQQSELKSIQTPSGKWDGTQILIKSSTFTQFPQMVELWTGVSWRTSLNLRKFSG